MKVSEALKASINSRIHSAQDLAHAPHFKIISDLPPQGAAPNV